MKTVLTLCVVAFLGGCASVGSVSPGLSGMSNVEIGPGPNGFQYVNRVSYLYDITPRGDALPSCVAQLVPNRPVTLKDSSSMKFVPFVGMVQEDSAREVGGGQAIKYVSDDKRAVVAEGTTSYQRKFLGIPIDVSLRFNLSIKSSTSGLSVVYTNLESAQVDTGMSKNDGYTKLGAWSGADPEIAIDALNRVSNDLSECVTSS